MKLTRGFTFTSGPTYYPTDFHQLIESAVGSDIEDADLEAGNTLVGSDNALPSGVGQGKLATEEDSDTPFIYDAAGWSEIVRARSAKYFRGIRVQANLAARSFTITEGEAADGTGKRILKVSGTLTVDCSLAGAANRLDTGTLAAATLYYVYLIYNETTHILAGLLSASATAPVMPSGYTLKRLIGFLRTQTSSATFLDMTQVGKRVFYNGAPTVASGSTNSFAITQVSLTSWVPADIGRAVGLSAYAAPSGSFTGSGFYGIASNSGGANYPILAFLHYNSTSGAYSAQYNNGEVPIRVPATPYVYHVGTISGGGGVGYTMGMLYVDIET